MPEISNNFRLGRMEKDLDDRLVPNSGYRDALNVEVATSEGSDVGALQKVLGNTLISGLPALTNATCIGSVRDTQNNKIYWFITSNGADVIAEYDGTNIDLILVDTGATAKVNGATSSTTTLVVDNNSGTIQVGDTLTGGGVIGDVTVATVTNQNNLVLSSAQSLSDNTDITFKSVLKFNTSNLIIGVNILDKVLYFTDNLNEPRQVDIEYWRGQTGTTLVTSTGLSADKITVIRKSPISSPTFSSISSATVTGPGTINGDQILMKINDDIDLNLSGYTVGQVVSPIKFVRAIDSTTAVDTNFIVGTRFDSTSEEGYVVSFTVTAVDTSGSNHSFTAVVDAVDDRILPSDSNTFAGSSSFSQTFIKSGYTGTTQSSQIVLNGETIVKLNFSGSTQIVVPTTDTYNVTFNINISQIDTTVSNRNIYAKIKKGGNDISGAEINWTDGSGSTPGIKQLVLTNQALNAGDVITIHVADGNRQSVAPTSNQTAPIFTVSSTGTNWSFDDASAVTADNNYTVVAKQEYGFFEDKFPRFSYRYKYDNGQYSGFAPFSDVAFMPGQFDYDTKNAYNLGMLNKINGLTITGWNSDISARSISFVDEVDLLYKTSNDQNIYIVDTIKKVGGSIASTYNIKNEQIFKVVDSMQLLRSFDSVPLKAKAQEIVGNRLVYANYTENFDYTSTPEFLVSTTSRADPAPNLDNKFSVKSNRTYQLGIIFQDVNGRQTPVFTSNSGIFKIDPIRSNLKNQIITSLKTTAPAEATHYRYFIKETSLEYYNISVSNFYSDDEGFIYLSIPSSEINKVKTGDYLNLKKKNGVNEYFYSKDNKHKVLGVDGNPPDFLAKSKTTIHFAKYVGFGQDFATTTPQTTKKPNLTPVEGYNTIQLRQLHDTAIGGNVGASSLAFLKEGALLRFVKGDFSTKTYEIKSVAITDHSSNKTAEVSFNKPFGKEVVNLYLDNTNNSLYDGIGVEFITETNSLGNPNYTNKSFIKLNESTLLGAGLLDTINEDDLSISASTYIKRLASESFSRDFYVESLGNYTLTIITQQAYTHAESKYSNSIFANSLIKGKYIRISDTSFNNFGKNKILFEIKSITETLVSISGITDRKKYVITLDKSLTTNGFTGSDINTSDDVRIDILSINNNNTSDLKSPCIFEVEPEEGLLDIYYDTDEVYPVSLLRDNDSPVATASVNGTVTNTKTLVVDAINTGTNFLNHFVSNANIDSNVYVVSHTTVSNAACTLTLSEDITINNNQPIKFYSSTSLKYSNCISFGNGVESDRIRDDFNAPTMGKGVKASAVFEDNYGQEERTNSFIYSQIYNSKSGVNRLNQFIIADKITKEINPSHGSIQLIKTRDTDLIALCEDKCFRVQANKDALFTADGNAQVVASSNVLGQVIPYVGEYGISKNPESFAQYGFRAYFTDRERGVVLRLSRDGLSEISALGMSDFFSDKLANVTSNVFGSYDDRKNSYNLSFTNQANSDPTETISFNERVNGWTSRKSFVPETAISLNNDYFSFKAGSMYKHHSNTETNDFYTVTTAVLSQATSYEYEITLTQSNSDIAVGMYVSGETIPSGVTVSSLSGGYFISTNNLVIPSGTKLYFSSSPITEKKSSVKFLMNQPLGQVKRFKTLNYQGDTGWLLNTISTPEHVGEISSDGFIKKEGKYFATVNGKTATASTLNAEEIQVEGLGTVDSVVGKVLTFNDGVNSNLQVGDNIYFLADNAVASYTLSGACTVKTATKVTIPANGTAPAAGKFVLFDKGGVVNQSGLLGFFAEVEMKHTTTSAAELFSVGSLIV